MKYIDYFNWNPIEKKDCKETKISVDKTSFNNNVYYIKIEEYTENWSIQYDILTGRQNGIETYIKYDEDMFSASTSAQDKTVEVEGIKYISDSEKSEEKLVRCFGRFKISAGIDFTSKIADDFWATRLATRMSKKREKVNLGEYMRVRAWYGMIKGKPRLGLEILDLNPLDKQEPKPSYINLGKEKIPYEFCKEIEAKFIAEHICIQPEEPAADVEWKVPTDWISGLHTNSEEYKAAFRVKYAVYMWIGSRKRDSNKKYLYIGIVGTDNNRQNTVGNRIFDQELKNGIAAENGIDQIEYFRYSELKNSGKYSASHILQTVEMQCINNFSSFFPYNEISKKAGPETVIHPLFRRVFDDKKQEYLLELLNKKKRYKNS